MGTSICSRQCFFSSAHGRIAGWVDDVQIPHDVTPAVAGAVYRHLREADVLVAVATAAVLLLAAAAVLLQEQIQALRWCDVRAEPLGGVAATVIRDLAHQSRGPDDLSATCQFQEFTNLGEFVGRFLSIKG